MKSVLSVATIAICSCAPSPGPIKRQMIGLLEKFDRWDYNGNGELTQNELKEAEGLSGFTAKEIVEFYDTDGDDRVSLREAQAGMSRMGEARALAAEQDA